MSRLPVPELLEFGCQPIPFRPKSRQFVRLPGSPRLFTIYDLVESQVQDILFATFDINFFFDDLLLHLRHIDFLFDDLILHLRDIDLLFDNLLLFDVVEGECILALIAIQFQSSKCGFGLSVEVIVLNLGHGSLLLVELSGLVVRRRHFVSQRHNAIDHVEKEVHCEGVVLENVPVRPRPQFLVLLESLWGCLGRHQNQRYLLELLVLLDLRADRVAAHLWQLHAQHNKVIRACLDPIDGGGTVFNEFALESVGSQGVEQLPSKQSVTFNDQNPSRAHVDSLSFVSL